MNGSNRNGDSSAAQVHMQLAMAATTRKITGTDTQSLRDELQEFVLENVEMFGEERVLGTGSYGSVQEVKSLQLQYTP